MMGYAHPVSRIYLDTHELRFGFLQASLAVRRGSDSRSDLGSGSTNSDLDPADHGVGSGEVF
jgi:hypothetical protein